MGIQGLLSYCLEKRDQCSETFDLVEVARQQDGIELLIDFYSFEHLILNNFWIGLSELRNNPFLRIYGGEYGTLDTYLTKLVQDLKSLGISLVFYIDGSKGSSDEATRQKLDTWIKRHENDVQKLEEILAVCRGQKNIADLPNTTNVRPVLLEIQFVETLIKCDCEVHTCPAGEADFLIAQELAQRPKAFACLSNDSDFCIFKESRWIPNELFDMNADLQLGKALAVPDKPLRLMVGVISTEKVMNVLKFNNQKLLVEMSIVAGNDFTGPFMRGYLQEQLDIRGRRGIENIAGWMRHYKDVQNHPLIAREMNFNPNFKNAVYHSRRFYNLTGNQDQPPRKGYFSQLIEEGVKNNKLPGTMMGMHNNFYWHRMLLEDTAYGQPCVECALTELRSYVYRIVLPRQECLVNEYGRSPYEKLRKAGVMAADDRHIPAIHHIDDNIFKNLKHFHYIMTHQEHGMNFCEPGTDNNWFHRYGRKNGFIVYIMRYFLFLNWGRNLHISENEFLALIALAFSRSKEQFYQQIALRPTPRGITIGNWFQDLYRHAYLFLGKLLRCNHEFPTPDEIFCGSVWAAFYMCCKDETFYLGVNQVPMELLQQTQVEMNQIIKEKRHMIRYIVEGVFPFDDRY